MEADQEEKNLVVAFEMKAVRQILKLEKEFRNHEAVVKAEAPAQLDTLGKLHKLTETYLILGTDEDIFFYDDGVIEDAIVADYNSKVELLRESLNRVGISLKRVGDCCDEFVAATAHLNMEAESVVIEDITIDKPISFFVDLLKELFQYFQIRFLKWQYCLSQMDPEYLGPLEAFKAVIKSSEKYRDHFIMSLTYTRLLTQMQQS